MSAAMDALTASITELQSAVDQAIAKFHEPNLPAAPAIAEADVAAVAQKISDLAGMLKAAIPAPVETPAS